jgi:hypothetical protein
MIWENISVDKYQRYVKLVSEIKDTEDAIEIWDFNISLVALMYDRTIRQVECMTNQDFIQDLKALDFLKEQMPDKPIKSFRVNGHWYRLAYDARKVRNVADLAKFYNAGDVISVKQFSSDFVGNIHKVMASLVVPQKKAFGMKFDLPYDYQKHEQYSEDMLEAPITAIYGYCLFFCKVFEKQIKALVDYLGEDLNMTAPEIRTKILHLQRVMDGFTMLPKSQPTKGLNWTKSGSLVMSSFSMR